ncbi:MAG: glycosyltransferase family 39 protein [Myxococcaceae bacterium]|nr:glycosyltransferase family 39 protein [Myxococcaceae bacterium]
MGVVPGVLTLMQLGRLHPDEVYQYLEPANWRAFGYGILAWEWQPQGGLRNWAIPGLFAWLLKLCAALGIDDPWKRRAVLEVPQAALNVWMLYAAWRLAARRVNEHVARWAIPMAGLYMPVLTFAGRTLGESFSAAFLVIGLELLDREDTPKGKEALAAGAVLGLSVVARYGSAAAVLGAMLLLLARRRFRAFGLATAGGLAVAAALGALDYATWGAPFHSLRQYLDFNVFSGKAAAQFGQDPYTIYLPYLAMLAPWVWLGIPKRPSGIFVAAGLAYLAAIFFTAHKEVRFIYPAMVMLSVGAVGASLEVLSKRGLGLTAAATAASLTFFFFETPLKPDRPEQFRLTARAWPEATGFFIIPEGTWGAGGYFWLGKNIPWFTCDFPQQFAPAVQDARFNRAINIDNHYDAELTASGFQILQRDGRAKLWGR